MNFRIPVSAMLALLLIGCGNGKDEHTAAHDYAAVTQAAGQELAGEARGISFPISCSAESQAAFGRGLFLLHNMMYKQAQAEFNEAVTLLHSFEYPETSKPFQKIMEQDPECAMAYWGGAMSLWHPLWAPPSGSELEQGARLLAMTDSLEMSAREASYIEALKSFFSSTDINTHLDRARAYEQKMKAIYREHIDDPEARVGQRMPWI